MRKIKIPFPRNKRQWIRTALFVVAVAFITYFMPRPDEQVYKYELGHPWSYPTLLAKYDFEVYNNDETKKAMVDSIDRNFIPVYTIKDKPYENITQAMSKDSVFRSSYSYRNQINKILDEIYENGVIDAFQINQLGLKYLPEKIKVVSGDVSRIVNVSDLTPLTQAIYAFTNKMQSQSRLIDAANKASLAQLIEANFIPDVEATKQRYDAEVGTVDNVVRKVQKDEMLIDRGQIVDQAHFNLLKAYEEEGERQAAGSTVSAIKITIGQAIFALLIVAALYFYLYLYRREFFDRMSRLLCIITLLLLFFILSLVLSESFTSGLYIVPFAILPILLVVFFDAPVALFCLILEIIMCGAFAPLPYEFVTIEFAAGLTAIFSMRELSRRSQLLRTALFVFFAYVVSYVAIELMQMGSLTSFSWKLIGFFAINMVLTSFAYIMIFLVEKLFGLTSVVTLVELSDINNPLLRELSEKCPGTFQHSMAVGNLADAAARRIGANVQLVRCGALYHDIGKISNPAYFTENQHGVNPHNQLDAIQSARVIIRHINDGLRTADKAKLPKVIKDMIAQHHGKSTARYFYNTYCNANPGLEVDPAPFTYPGPNPQSKEASLLMMADVVEAASRSLPKHDTESITNLVNRLIDAQVAEGLHKDSPLSFRDITLIKEAFIDRLRTMYHVRIAYPDKKN